MPWRRYEKRKTKKHRGKHIGGPGNPDYIRGKHQGEVKCWNSPLPKSVVKSEAQKGRTEIISKRGFTKSAIEYAKRYRPDLKLIHGNRVVKRRRKK